MYLILQVLKFVYACEFPYLRSIPWRYTLVAHDENVTMLEGGDKTRAKNDDLSHQQQGSSKVAASERRVILMGC